MYTIFVLLMCGYPKVRVGEASAKNFSRARHGGHGDQVVRFIYFEELHKDMDKCLGSDLPGESCRSGTGIMERNYGKQEVS